MVEDAYPLAMLQSGMLFHSEFNQGSATYHNVTSYHLQAPFDLTRMQAAIAQVMQRRLTITGSTLRPRSTEFKGRLAQRLRESIWPLIEAGRIKPEIYRTFPLEQAPEAHRLMESSQHIGKLVLTV